MKTMRSGGMIEATEDEAIVRHVIILQFLTAVPERLHNPPRRCGRLEMHFGALLSNHWPQLRIRTFCFLSLMAKKETATGEPFALLTRRWMIETQVSTLNCSRDGKMDV